MQSWTFGPGGIYTATWDGASVLTVTATAGGAFLGAFTATSLFAAAQQLTRFSGVETVLPSVSGQFLCPPTQYVPASLQTLAVSSLTFAAFSSASVNTGNFNAPPSGSVLVTASFLAVMPTAAAAAAFALAAHGTVTPLVGNSVQGVPANTSQYQPTTIQFLVTGLTPGATYNFDLLGATGNVADPLQILALQLTATTITAGTRGGPVTMTVQAV